MREELREKVKASLLDETVKLIMQCHSIRVEEAQTSGEPQPTIEETIVYYKSCFPVKVERESPFFRMSKEEVQNARLQIENPVEALAKWFSSLDYSRTKELNTPQWAVQLLSRSSFEDRLLDFYYYEPAEKCGLTYLEYLEVKRCAVDDLDYLFYKQLERGESLDIQLNGELYFYDPDQIQGIILDRNLTLVPVRKWRIADELALDSLTYSDRDKCGLSQDEIRKAFPQQSSKEANWGQIRTHRVKHGLCEATKKKLEEPCDVQQLHDYPDRESGFRRAMLQGGHRIVIDFGAPDDVIISEMKKFLKRYRKENKIYKPKTQMPQLKRKLAHYKVLEYKDLCLFCLANRINITDRTKAKIVYGKDVSDTQFNQTIKPFLNDVWVGRFDKTLAIHVKPDEVN